MNKLILLSILLLAIGYNLEASYIVSGRYIDKYPNPIAGANVYLLRNGDTLSRGITDSQGNFSLITTSTSINSINDNLNKSYPNPFSESVNFNCTLPETGGQVFITNISGVIIDEYAVSSGGLFQFRWGGLSATGKKVSAGIYYVFIKTEKSISNINKLIYTGTSGNSRLTPVSNTIPTVKKENINSKGDTDTLLFLKKNTTPLFYLFTNVEQDLNVGQVEGNVGPEPYDFPVQKILEDENLMLPLDTYVYNDENSVFTPRNPKFTFDMGFLYFSSPSECSDSTWIDIVDWNDANLTDSVFVKVIVESKWSKVTFIFKSAAEDTELSSGTSTLKYRLMNPYGGGYEWAEDSIKTSENGYVKLRMLKKRTYDIDGKYQYTWDDLLGVDYLFLKRATDLEAFEQRARDDNYSPVLFSSEFDTINVYKLLYQHPTLPNFQLPQMIQIVSYLDGLNIGIRKFSKNDANAPAWWDGNYVASIPIQKQWIDEIRADLQSIPHVYLNLPFIESTETPTVPHLRIAVSDAFPAPGTNGTGYDPVTNCITVGDARYPVVYSQYSEYTFKIEILQAIGDLNDIGGGDPAIMEVYGDDKRRLNTLGKQIFTVMFLAQPKTKF